MQKKDFKLLLKYQINLCIEYFINLFFQTSSEPSTNVKKKTEKKSLWQTPTWQTSVGNTSKSSLSGLVKKKPQLVVKSKNTTTSQEKKNTDSVVKEETKSNIVESNSLDGSTDITTGIKVSKDVKETVKPSGLSLLGGYSDSDNSEDDT